MKAPPRLLNDPAVATELRADLERVAATTPSYDVAAGLAGLQAAIASAAAPASQTPVAGQEPLTARSAGASGPGNVVGGSAGPAGLTGLKAALIGVGAVALLSLAGVSTFRALRRDEPKPAAAALSVSARESANANSESANANSESATANSESATANSESAIHAKSSPAQGQASAAPIQPTTVEPSETAESRAPDVLRREIAQLARIKQLVDDDPARAYRLAQTGHREFKGGMLRQEREALAVLALAKLGETAQARTRAHDFLARYPASPLRDRVQAVLREDASE
jgi:hypothetical protein